MCDELSFREARGGSMRYVELREARGGTIFVSRLRRALALLVLL